MSHRASDRPDSLGGLFHRMFKPHPWHGVSPGERAPELVRVFIEIVPTDTVKYELDKDTGHLRVDRPQKYSNVSPSLYGFIPRTFCGERVAALAREVADRPSLGGDQDPMDICVLSEKAFTHGDFFLDAFPIGGFRLIDGDEADDKIVAVLEGDVAYSGFRELGDLPEAQIERLQHYFLTYKQGPWAERRVVEIPQVYGREEAYRVIEESRADYRQRFGDLGDRLDRAMGLLEQLAVERRDADRAADPGTGAGRGEARR